MVADVDLNLCRQVRLAFGYRVLSGYLAAVCMGAWLACRFATSGVSSSRPDTRCMPNSWEIIFTLTMSQR